MKKICPNKYPIFVISYNRAKNHTTSRTLSEFEIPHYLVLHKDQIPEYKKHFNEKQNKTATIRCYDKLAIENAKKLLENVEFVDNMNEAAENADLIIVMNEDKEFIQLSLLNKTIFDFRGIMPYKQNIYKIGVHDFDA